MSKHTPTAFEINRNPSISQDTCHVVTVFNADRKPAFEILLYGLDDSDVYRIPNLILPQVIMSRKLWPGYSSSPFLVQRLR